MNNELYVLERYNKEDDKYEYLHESSVAKNIIETCFFRWTKKLCDAKIFRRHQESNKYESIYKVISRNMQETKKRRLIVLREEMKKSPKIEAVEIF